MNGPVALLVDAGGSDIAPETSWSSRGTIAYDVFSLGQPRSIWFIEPDGSGHRRISGSPSMTYSEPAWAPDGRSIVFYSGTGPEDAGLWIMAANGSTRFRLELNPFNFRDRSPAWGR